MATREIRCPSCGAAPPPAPVRDGTFACAYCGARYSVSVGAWAPGSAPASNEGRTIAIAIIVPVLVVVLAGAGAAMWFLTAADSPSPPSTPPVAVDIDPTPLPEPVSVLPPPPEGPLSAEFVHHTTQKSLTNALYVLGEVTNTSEVTIDKPEIFVVLVDDAGNEVGVHNGYAAYDNLAPGESSPVEVLVMDPKPYASMRFEVKPRKSTYVVPKAEGLELEVDPPVRDRFSGIVHTGKVHNRGKSAANFVQVFCLARDEQGKLLDVDSTFATGEDALPAGDTARFKTIGVRLETEPAKFDLVVIGRPKV